MSVVNLEEVKLFLRVDGDEEDALITSLILTSTALVEGVIRRELTEFESVPETLKQAVLITLATLYENRQSGKGGLITADMLDLIKRLTFAYRKEEF